MTARLSISLHAVSVRRGEKWVLRDVSLALKAGERWALIGGNGAGKTQLLKTLSADIWPTPTGRETRDYTLGRRAVDVIAAKRKIAYIGAELQDKYARYGWNLTVRDVLATGLHRTDLLQQLVTRQQACEVSAMLTRCDLESLADRRFLTLSYGQKRLVLLTRGLAQQPDWLLLDEFYNGLDTEFRGRVDRVLQDARTRGQSWVAAAHRAADVPRGTLGVIELRAGRIASVKRLSRADLARLAAQAGEKSPLARVKVRPATRRPALRRSAEVLVRLAQVDLFVEYRAVLRGLDWELRQGEQWAVFGANGAGKSSLLKLLYGDLSPAQGGIIERQGIPRGTQIAAWKRQVGYVAPELQTDYLVDVSVHDLVASGLHASIGLVDAPTAAERRQVRRWLEFFSLASFAKRRPRELSYGQLRRALFARALAGNPRVLLLDEPLTGLDPRQRAAIKRLLERLMRRQITLVMAVHHAEDLPRGITHSLHLIDGRAYRRDADTAN